MLLVCPQLALAMPFFANQPAPSAISEPACAPRSRFRHGALALAMSAAMCLLWVDFNLPLH